jgi:hypothetical protein
MTKVLRYNMLPLCFFRRMVGATRFERATSCSQSGKISLRKPLSPR